MDDLMTFPDTWEEFEQDYGFTDVEQVYTNGSRLIQSFRVEQWLDHISAETRAETDTISRQAAIKIIKNYCENGCDIAEDNWCPSCQREQFIKLLETLPSAQQEPLTDKEKRIFLAAMDREMKVCEEIDRNYVREPYEDSLVSVCREIKRKVKGAL